MSLDFECYLAKKPLRKIRNIVGENWQIAIHGPFAFEREDISSALYDQIAPRSWVLNIHLEGIADDLAYQELEKLLSGLIAKRDACIFDPQEGSILSRSGKLSLPPDDLVREEPKVMSLKFYFDPVEDFDRIQKEEFFNLMTTFAPKSLPRRYGRYTPMPYNLKEHGKEHFLDSWEADHGLYWRGTAPFQWVFNLIKNPSKLGPNPVGYRYSTIEFQISAKVLNTKKALSELLIFQAEISKFLDVFYSEIKHETSSRDSNWRGLPRDPALSVCVGSRYSALWPEFQEGAESLGNGVFMRDYITSNLEKISPPQELVRPDLPKDNPRNSAPPLAKVFPFTIHKKFKGIPERYKA